MMKTSLASVYKRMPQGLAMDPPAEWKPWPPWRGYYWIHKLFCIYSWQGDSSMRTFHKTRSRRLTQYRMINDPGTVLWLFLPLWKAVRLFGNIAVRASDYHRVLHQKFWSSQCRQTLAFQQKQYGNFPGLTQMTVIADGNDHTGTFWKLFSYK